MPVHEFLEWMVYESLEPFGDRRSDILAGIIAATIANVNRTSTNQDSYSPDDFMINWEPKPIIPQTVEELESQFLLLQATQNARINASQTDQ